MKLKQGLTTRQSKRMKKSSSESNGKKASWVEYDSEIGLLKNVGSRAITNNHGNVGKVNKKVAKIRGTF